MRADTTEPPECPGCRERDRRIERLEKELERLSGELEKVRRAQKRQAAPFSKGEPKPDPKPPGRKPGLEYGRKAHRPAPTAVNEVHDAPLPRCCPDCGGAVEETHVVPQYQVEIPRRPIHRRFDVHIGQCRQCGRRVQGRHRLQTSDALGAASSQLGPDAQAAIVELNKHLGLSHGKVVRCLKSLFGIRLSRGGSAQAMLRVARRLEPTYQMLSRTVRRARQVVLDETGWRIGGRSAWLHTLVTRRATVYAIGDRSSAVAMGILGATYSGVLVHDGWAPYDQFGHARHQQCLQHPLRRSKELLEGAVRGAVRLPRRVIELLGAALELRERREAGIITPHGLAVARGWLKSRLRDLVWPAKTNPANERLAQHVWNYLDEFFSFLEIPGIDATNWRAEHALRFAVVNRKVWGGSRTTAGARAQAILLSVWRTTWQRALPVIEAVSRVLKRPMLVPALPP
jgi:transposase